MFLELRFLVEHGKHNPAHRLEVLKDLRVGEPSHAESLEFQRWSTHPIMALALLGVVAVAVNLDDKPLAGAIKVGDVVPKRLLPSELVRQVAE